MSSVDGPRLFSILDNIRWFADCIMTTTTTTTTNEESTLDPILNYIDEFLTYGLNESREGFDMNMVSRLFSEMNETDFDPDFDMSNPRVFNSILQYMLGTTENFDNLEDVKVTLSPEDFERLETIYSESKDNICVICTDTLKGEKCKKLLCNHIFHEACIKEWLLKYNTTCPDCRRDQRIK